MTEIFDDLFELRSFVGRLSRNGLPPADTAFWSDPGPKLGGYLALRLRESPLQEHGVRRLDLRPKPKLFARLTELRRHLHESHADQHLYRGQRRRYETLYRGAIPRLSEAFPDIRAVEFQLESLTPSRYRRIASARPAAWAKSPPPGQPLDDYAAPMRAILRSGHADLLRLFHDAVQSLALDTIRLSMAQRANIGWGGDLAAQGTNTSKALARLISVAQHYEYGSVMVDVTRSVDVALSFATHDWVNGARTPSPDGGGVIYRFDRGAIERAMQDLLKGGLRSAWLPPLAIFGVTDIHDIGFDLRRPALQEGGSLFGIETAAAHFVMHVHDAMEAFVFEEDDLSANEAPPLASLRPADDPGLSVFDLASRNLNEPLDPAEITDAFQTAGMEQQEIDRMLRWRRDGVV